MRQRTLGNKAPVLRALAGALLSAGLLTVPLAAQSQALRPEVGKPLQQAGELLKANKAKEALAKVREAENVAESDAAGEPDARSHARRRSDPRR